LVPVAQGRWEQMHAVGRGRLPRGIVACRKMGTARLKGGGEVIEALGVG